MLKLRINPLVVGDLREIRDYIAEDNEEYAAKTIQEIYNKFESIQIFPGIGREFKASLISFSIFRIYFILSTVFLTSEIPICLSASSIHAPSAL